DEIEKAHPDVFNLLLQVLDDGRITDSQGKTVDFRNTVLILTSNLGSDIILDSIGADGEIDPAARERVSVLLKRSFRPEFLNRLDEIVFYRPLTRENIVGIVGLQPGHLAERIAGRGYSLKVSDDVKEYVATEAYDPTYGARPVKRFIQANLETPLAKLIVSECPPEGTVFRMSMKDGRPEIAVDDR
ncbi:MAG: AAA family ATPase, partial [Clostridia bacterium]|nr:AAA family ATPase [Clostridia bacterium]